LNEQREKGHCKLLGELLVEMDYCTDNQIASALAEAYGVPYAQVSPKATQRRLRSCPETFSKNILCCLCSRSTTSLRSP
jgi:hypothetical protein